MFSHTTKSYQNNSKSSHINISPHFPNSTYFSNLSNTTESQKKPFKAHPPSNTPTTTLLTLKATDPDSGQNGKLSYIIENIEAIFSLTPKHHTQTIDMQDYQDYFNLNSLTGELTNTNKSVDREIYSSFEIQVEN